MYIPHCTGVYMSAGECMHDFVLCPGVYISKISYVRSGEHSLDGYYKPYHTVVYYRYLRFFPDGQYACTCTCVACYRTYMYMYMYI